MNDHLPENTFLNIVVSFAIAKDFKAIDQLIDQYLKKVPFEHQEQTKNLTLAFKYFHQAAFQKAYDLIRNFKESTIHYKLRTRLLKLRCLYEIQLTDHRFHPTLLYEINAYESLFKREYQIAENSAEMYLNFSEALRTIIHRNTKKPISKIKTEILKKLAAYETLVARKWLVEKVNQLT